MDRIDFNKYAIEGCAVLKGVTEDGNYIYEMFWRNNAEDSGDYFFGILVSDAQIIGPIEPTVYGTFNKRIVTGLVQNNEIEILNKAKELNAEVFGFDYRNSSSYRNTEPWASIDDAIRIAKKEIEEGKVEEDIIGGLINKALSKVQKRNVR